jgi:hypothetical protein
MIDKRNLSTMKMALNQGYGYITKAMACLTIIAEESTRRTEISSRLEEKNSFCFVGSNQSERE